MNLNQLVKNLHQGSTAVGLKEDRNILWLNEVTFEDSLLVGEKNASLGELTQKLSKLGINVPKGFTITSHAFSYFLEQTGLRDKLSPLLIDLDKTTSLSILEQRSKTLRSIIMDSEFPELLKLQILRAYKTLEDHYEEHVDVALRSSATSKQLSHSFSGLHDSYFNIHSEEQVIHYVKRCFASLFSLRALQYRLEYSIKYDQVLFSVSIQKMINSSNSVAGSISTLDPNSGFDKVVVINSSYGLGELISNNAIEPDEYVVFKPTLEEGYKSLISKNLGEKHLKKIYDVHGTQLTKDILTSKKEQESYSISDNEALELARLSIIIEDHISSKFGSYQPVMINWVKDEVTGEFVITSVSPENIHSKNTSEIISRYSLEEEGSVLLTGQPIGDMISHGEVRVIHQSSDFSKFKEGEVLVTDLTDEQFEPLMRKASAVITNRGNRNSHTTTFANELKIPIIVDSKNATQLLRDGDKITISCENDIGYIFSGYLKYKVTEISKEMDIENKTKSLIDLTSPSQAFESSKFYSAGIGHFSQSSILTHKVKIHPNALLYFDELKKNPHAKTEVKEIESLTKSFDDKVDYYIDTVSRELAKVAASTYPKKAYVTFSDLNSKSYYSLLGGKFFEPLEDNLHLGYQGVSKFLSREYIDAFKLECLTIRKVREELGFKNLKLVIPLCRTVEELKEILSVMEGLGLSKSHDGLEILLSCSTPGNVILLDKFLNYVDGVSIDINHLSQLTLGYDQSLDLDTFNYNSDNESIKELLLPVIHRCNERNKFVTIHGLISNSLLSSLISQNIQSVSFSMESLPKSLLEIQKLEHNLSKKSSIYKPGFTIKTYQLEREATTSSKNKKDKKKVVKKTSSPKKLTSKENTSKKNSISSKKKITPKKKTTSKKK